MSTADLDRFLDCCIAVAAFLFAVWALFGSALRNGE